MRSKIFLLAIISFILKNFCHAQYTKLFDFDYSTTGAYPHHGALISDGTYLYGTTSSGGDGSGGTIFKIKRDGSDFQKLYDGTDTTAYVPESSLLLVDGYLYGTSLLGGTYGFGTVFRIKPDGTDFSIITSFDLDNDGGLLYGSLYYDGSYLYGTTSQGGINNGGTIYKLKTDGGEFNTIYDFTSASTDGSGPYAHLISDGTYLYGMTVSGGSVNQGVAFRIKTNGTGYQKLLDFTDDPTGSSGYGALVYDGSAYLYGMTNNGGEYNRGTIFKVKTDGTGYEKLLDMNNDDGAQPLGSLILAGTTIYGMTELGCTDGDAKGEMFSIETDGSNYTELVDFDGDNGSIPFGTLLYEDGAIFGMTTEGGTEGRGVIFRYGDIIENINEMHISHLDIYPNPAENNITISLPQRSEQDIYAEIINAVGDIIFSGKLKSGDPIINISEIPAGVYIIKAMQDKNVYTDKVIIK